LLVFDRPLGTRPPRPTGRAQVIYAFTILDLGRTGPVMAEIPPGFLGNFWDFHHRGLASIGQANSAGGGRFLLLPPGHDADAAPGVVVVRCPTGKIFGGGRCIIKPGDSAEPFIDLLSSIRVYPLARAEQPPPLRVILNRDRPFQQGWPKDLRYFNSVAEALPPGSAAQEDRLMCEMLQPLGITPGAPFAPDDRMRRILSRAATAGAAMTTTAFATRLHGRQIWGDRQWERTFSATAPPRDADDGLAAAEPAQGWYQVIGDGRYVFASTLKAGEAQWYSSTFHDGHGRFLDGSSRYRLTLPAERRQEASWSITIHDDRRSGLDDGDRPQDGLSADSNLKVNGDGSIDLHFSPAAPAGMERNWIRTVPGREFFAVFRLFAPLDPVLDGTWKLNDVERVRG
jgi:hypothetical protein